MRDEIRDGNRWFALTNFDVPISVVEGRTEMEFGFARGRRASS